MAHKSPLPETAEEVEALAGRQTLGLALEVGTHEVELEGDAGVALGKSEVGDRPRPHLKIRSHPKKF